MSDGRSSFAPADWLPLQEEVLRGLNHALSNRMASLSAVVLLMDGADPGDERMRGVLESDVTRLHGLLELYRAVPAARESRREPVALADSLPRAAALLEQHHATRDLVLGSVEQGDGVEPVTLWAPDALRACVMLLLAVARDAPGTPEVRARLSATDGWQDLAISCAGSRADDVRGRREYGALERFAAVEGGALSLEDGVAGATLALRLPGLGRVRRGDPAR